MCSLCCLCTYPATPISNRPPAMCGQHEPPVRPAAPRFESRRCDLCQSWGEDEPDSLRYLKVANRSGSEVEGSPARAEAQRSAASAKRAETSYRGIPKGAALGAPLVTFSATGKSPGVEGRSALPMGVVGAEGPHLGGAQRRALALLASGFAGAHSRPLPIKSRRQLSAFALI